MRKSFMPIYLGTFAHIVIISESLALLGDTLLHTILEVLCLIEAL